MAWDYIRSFYRFCSGIGVLAMGRGFQSRQISSAIVATAITPAPMRYMCDRIQLGDSSPNTPGTFRPFESTSGDAASQSRHNFRPSDTGKPQVSHLPKLPNAMVVIGLDNAASARSSRAAGSSGVSANAEPNTGRGTSKDLTGWA